MSGSTPPGKPGPGGADPAMDDILASIRRILNEDEAAAGAAAVVNPDAPPAPFEPLELTEAMLVASPPPPPEPPPAPPAMSVTVPVSAEIEPDPMPAPAPPRHFMPPASPDATLESPLASPAGASPSAPPLGSDGLLAPAVAAATTAALGQLLRSVAAERQAPVYRGGPSIEDVVREELRPLLKEWLDQHLPPLVERLVRVEIERVVGRALP